MTQSICDTSEIKEKLIYYVLSVLRTESDPSDDRLKEIISEVIGIDHSDRLMELLADLCTKEDTGALVVAEGWRVSELLRLIRWCDTLHILLPARMCTEDTGMTKELDLFKRTLPSGSLMTVHYCEDYRQKYESINM